MFAGAAGESPGCLGKFWELAYYRGSALPIEFAFPGKYQISNKALALNVNWVPVGFLAILGNRARFLVCKLRLKQKRG